MEDNELIGWNGYSLANIIDRLDADYYDALEFKVVNDPENRLSEDFRLKIIEAATQIAGLGYSSERIFPWRDVAVSMLNNPEKVVFRSERCPKCGAHTVKLFFKSPPSTWSKLCGCAGKMVVCQHCKSQNFQCMIRN